MENNPIDKCIICGKDTPYKFSDYIQKYSEFLKIIKKKK